MTAELQYLHRALINVWIKFMMLVLICTALNYMGFVRDHMSLVPCCHSCYQQKLMPDMFGIKEGKKVSCQQD